MIKLGNELPWCHADYDEENTNDEAGASHTSDRSSDRLKQAPCLLRACGPPSRSELCLRIPMKPAMHSNVKPATCSDPKAAGVPI